MSISERYRSLVEAVQKIQESLEADPPQGSRRPVTLAGKAVKGLDEFKESVGEIPRIRLEDKLSPVLLRAHADLDRCRMLLDEVGDEDRAGRVWDLEQDIYRLLNSL
ncbi:MAG: hypothetical protein GWO11_04400 [Desulfuromonadales bacterium]|nr:hypothetical protein [Desulfuromonadales bacterium]NIR33663.1 hypothetical protein [Desulfuromonadales bacterium]NIS43558.1 hypothetical protein [Desulfuromonadales bacterium]